MGTRWRWLALLLGVLLVLGPIAGVVPARSAADDHAGPGNASAPNPCVGTISQPPDGTTLLTIQGARAGDKTNGLLVAVGPRGRFQWVYNGTARGRWWVYDVDPLPNGNLLLATTEPGITVVEEIDQRTGQHVWLRRFRGVTDAHDVDLINGDELLMVDKGQGHHRVLIFNRTRRRVVWEWRFENYFPARGGGPPDDWTHVNDVDKVAPGRFMVSVRNFDQVIMLDRRTKEIVWRLGADDELSIMNEQHNPQYLRGKGGRPTVLVADSLNDRVVEYAREDGDWVRTWTLRGGGLDEPRDADRLPNGNTLVVDRLGHRILEVTPRGTVVWEVYAPWQPYDAERQAIGDEAGGPTMRERGVTGTHTIRESAGFDEPRIEACSRALGIAGRELDNGSSSGLLPDVDFDAGEGDGADDTPGRDDRTGTAGPSNDEPTDAAATYGWLGAGVVVVTLVVIAAVVRRRG